MFYVYEIEEKVGVHARNLKKNVEEGVLETLEERSFKGPEGVFLGVIEIDEIGKEGEIIPERPEVFFRTKYKALFFKPLEGEVVEGEVSDVVNFGAFVRLGPLEGLIHISQIMKETCHFNQAQNLISNKKGNKVLKPGDLVRCRIVSASIGEKEKIGLTMRQPWLGALKWLEEEKKRLEKAQTKK